MRREHGTGGEAGSHGNGAGAPAAGAASAAIVEAARAAGWGDLVPEAGCWLAFAAGTLAAASASGRRLAAREGWDRPGEPFPRRVRDLGPRLVAGAPPRFERLRLSGARVPALLALRSLRVGSGAVLLVTMDGPSAAAGEGAPRAGKPAPHRAAEEPVEETADDMAGDMAGDAAGEAVGERPAVPARRERFVWRTDEADRFRPAGLAGDRLIVVPDGGAWPDHVAGEASAVLASRRPFTAVPAAWRAGPDGLTIPVLVSGAPVRRAGAFAGFRGFALYDPADADRAAAAGETGAPGPLPAAGTAPADAAAEPVAAAPEPSHPSEAPAPTEPPGFIPILQAIVDVSVSGWSQLIGAIPAGRRPQQPAERVPAALPSDDTLPATSAAVPPSALSTTEQGALSEIARVLGAGLGEPAQDEPLAEESLAEAPPEEPLPEEPLPEEPLPEEPLPGEPLPEEPPPERGSATIVPLVPRPREGEMRRALDAAAVASLVHARGQLLFANAAFLDLIGVAELPALHAADWTRDLMDGADAARDRAAPAAPAAPRRLTLPCGEVEAVSAPLEWSGRRACLTLVWPAPADPAVAADGFAAELARRDERLADLKAALATVDEGLVTVDGHGRITSVSGAAQAQFGYAENEIAGEQLPVLFAPESRSDAFAFVERARLAAAGTAATRLRARGARRDGSAIELDLTARNVGEPGSGTVLLALSDASRERHLEALLESAERDLEAAHRQSGEILGRVGHEIRSPLTAIIGFADLLLEERLGPLADPRLRPYLEGIRSSGLDVLDRVGEFRRYTDALSGRIEMHPGECDLNAILSETVTTLQAASVRDRVVLRTSLAPNLPAAWLDAASTRQAVTHLLSGAIALTPPGGQVITATARADDGDVAWSVRAKDARLTPDDLEAALDPFAARANSLALPRSGFALAFARALIEANGAALTTSGMSEEGPLFEIRFAAAPVAEPAVPPPEPAVQPLRQTA